MSALVQKTLEYVDYCRFRDGIFETPVPGMLVAAHRGSTLIETHIYEPVVCPILQGRKEIWLGDQYASTGPGQSLIVSHCLPIKSQVIDATPDEPYIALTQTIDLEVIRGLIEEIGDSNIPYDHPQAMSVSETDAHLADAMLRAFDLTMKPDDIPVMAPLIQREIHFRLLRARHGGMLRELLNFDSSASRVSEAVNRIRDQYREQISVTDLARDVGMSPSSFHMHFKSVTAQTPLQYQKELRLLEARRLLIESSRSVSTIAFDVGYESASQFSREFSRKFGAPPTRIAAHA